MNPSTVIADDLEVTPVEAEPTHKELTRGFHLISRAMRRNKAHANEVKLKGFFTDWVFDKLNLTQYR